MYNPIHPGLIIRDDVLPELQLSVNEAAEQLGVLRVTLSRMVNGRSAVSALLRKNRKGRDDLQSLWLELVITRAYKFKNVDNIEF